jgi:hypothetical protein
MSLIGLATTDNVFAHSETGSVTLNTIAALVHTNLSMMAWNNATLSTLSSVGQTITTYN